MGDQWSYRGGSQSGTVDELAALQREQDELWAKLRGEVDPDRRMALLSEFGENRAEIERLTELIGTSGRLGGDAPVTYRVELVEERPAPAGRIDFATDDSTADRPLGFDASGELVPTNGLARAHAASLDVEEGFDDDLVPDEQLDDDLLPDDLLADEHGDREPSDHDQLDGDQLDGDQLDGAHPPQGFPRNGELDDLDQSQLDQSQHALTGRGARADDADLGRFDRVGAERTVRRRSASSRYVPPLPPSDQRPARTTQTPAVDKKARSGSGSTPGPDSSRRILLVLGGLGVVLAMAWFLLSRGSDDPATNVASEVAEGISKDDPAAPTADLELGQIVVGLRNLGLDGVLAERRDDRIFLVGTVPSDADRIAAVELAEATAPGQRIDTTELRVESAAGDANTEPGAVSGRAATYQTELNRVVASTPIIFAVDQAELTELHTRILNSVASIMTAYPEFRVTIVGFADGTGPDASNETLSLQRAQSVEAHLVGLGVPDDSLDAIARGEQTASGSAALASLERRVEFEVVAPPGLEEFAGAAPPIRVAIIGPSARNDLAFTQSMVDAADLVAADRGNVEISVTDSTFVPDDAAAAIRGYADDGYDLVVAHGSQFGALLLEIAPDYPEVAFAWGTASDTFGLPNVYAYDAAAHQGGYVLGSMSMLLSGTGVVGVVGPIEVGDAQLYVNGFQAGARASKPDATVLVEYTGSFSDLILAAEAAQSHVEGGADVLTGSAQMVVGAVAVAQENDAVWFGTQANQSSLAPSLVAASQVYHWEVILQEIINDIDAGALGGRSYTADLANGGLVIEYNPDFPLPAEVRQRGDEVIAGIIDGSIQVPVR